MNRAERFIKETGLELIATSSVWNYHNVDFNNFRFMKTSNVYFKLLNLKKSGLTGMVTILIQSIGRTQHSESSVSIFKGVTNSDAYSGYYNSGIGEVNLDFLN